MTGSRVHVLRLLLLASLSGVHAVDRAHAAGAAVAGAGDDEGRQEQAFGGSGTLFFGKSGAHQPQALFSGSGGRGRGGRGGKLVQDTGARHTGEHLQHAPPPSDCPKCDAIYAEWSELYVQQGFLIGHVDPFNPSNPDDSGYISRRLTSELMYFCEQGRNDINNKQYYCQYLGCYISKGNDTTVDSHAEFRAGMCDRVPFRELAHTITAYALNGSDMPLKIFLPAHPDDPDTPSQPMTFVVPNSWFVQTAFELNCIITNLPSNVRQAVKLAEVDVGPFPSISEVFDVKMRNATFAYIRATSASWTRLPHRRPRPVPVEISRHAWACAQRSPSPSTKRVFKAVSTSATAPNNA